MRIGLSLDLPWSAWRSLTLWGGIIFSFSYAATEWKTIIPHVYEDSMNFSESLAAVKVAVTNGYQVSRKWGYIDTNGQLMLPALWDEAQPFKYGRAWVLEGRAWGLIDLKGKVIKKPVYEKVAEFENGLCPVQLAEGWALVNEFGEIIGTNRFDDLGLGNKFGTRAKRNGKWGFVGKNAEWIVPPNYDMVWDFKEGWAPVSKEDKFGFISREDFAIPIDFADVGDFVDGLALAKVIQHETYGIDTIRWGFINKRGNFVIEPSFEAAGPFSNNLARVQVEGTWTYIDKRGKFLFPPSFDKASDFSEGLAAIMLGSKWGYINDSGKTLFAPQWDEADNFENGLALVRNQVKEGLLKKTKWGVVSNTGEVLLEPKYEFIGKFKSGFAKFRQIINLLPKWGVIDVRGKVIVPPIYEEMGEMSDRRLKVRLNGKNGYLTPVE